MMTLFVKHSRQDGVALPIAMMILVAMMLAAVTLIRSVDTATMVAGNLTYKQRASLAADEGVRAAYIWLRNTGVANPSALNNTIPGEAYFSSQHASDPDWNPAAYWPATSKTLVADSGGNTVSYVIHRLCTLPGVAYNATNNQCATWESSSSGEGGSQSATAADFKGVIYIYYRITARAEGPRNASSYIQSLVLVPAG